jgi:hypothetical protein
MFERAAMTADKGDRRRALVSMRLEHRTLGRTGVNVNPTDAGYDNPALRPEARRR